MRKTLTLLGVLTALSLVSCGGSSEPVMPAIAGANVPVAQGIHPEVLMPQAAAKGPLATVANPTPDEIFDWGEQNFAGYFPSHQVSATFSPYYYRYYPQTNIYLAVNADLVQVYGPNTFGPNLITVGTIADFRCLVHSCVAAQPPTATAGANQLVYTGDQVMLTGSGSDSLGAPLTYTWSFVSKPVGSAAAFADNATATPSFTPDLQGNYVVQLIVNNGTADSQPSTLTVTALYRVIYQ